MKPGRLGQRDAQQGGTGRRAARQCKAKDSRARQGNGRKAGQGEEQQGRIGQRKEG